MGTLTASIWPAISTNIPALSASQTQLEPDNMFKGYMIRTLQKDKASLHKACFLWKARQAPKWELITSMGTSELYSVSPGTDLSTVILYGGILSAAEHPIHQ